MTIAILVAVGIIATVAIFAQAAENDRQAAAEQAAAERDALREELFVSCVVAVRTHLDTALSNPEATSFSSTRASYKVHGIAHGGEFACVMFPDGEAYSAFFYPRDENADVQMWTNQDRPSPADGG